MSLFKNNFSSNRVSRNYDKPRISFVSERYYSDPNIPTSFAKRQNKSRLKNNEIFDLCSNRKVERERTRKFVVEVDVSRALKLSSCPDKNAVKLGGKGGKYKWVSYRWRSK